MVGICTNRESGATSAVPGVRLGDGHAEAHCSMGQSMRRGLVAGASWRPLFFADRQVRRAALAQ